MYTMDECSWYQIQEINGIKIIVFDDHNKALPVWGTISNLSGHSCQLFTFDYHTDTHPPFHTQVVNEFPISESYKNSPQIKNLLESRPCYLREDFWFEDVFCISAQLKNDEHIKTAVDFGYLDSYVVFCKSDIDGYEDDDKIDGYIAKYYTSNDFTNLTEKDLLNMRSTSPTILDFDLDFFSTKEDIFIYLNLIKPLVANAKAITIAREIEYFEALRDDNKFSNQEAEKLLIDGLRNIIESL